MLSQSIHKGYEAWFKYELCIMLTTETFCAREILVRSSGEDISPTHSITDRVMVNNIQHYIQNLAGLISLHSIGVVGELAQAKDIRQIGYM